MGARQDAIAARGLAARAQPAVAGVSLGAARAAYTTMSFSDDNVRPNTAPGSLGTPLSGATYDIRGFGGSLVNGAVQIQGNKIVNRVYSGNDRYAYISTRLATPVTAIGGVFGWDAVGGSATTGAIAFLVSSNPGGASFLTSLWPHVSISQLGVFIGLFESAIGTVTTFSNTTFSTPLQNGVDYVFDGKLRGNTLLWKITALNGTQQTAVMQGACPLPMSAYGLGNYAVWELANPTDGTTPIAAGYFKAQWAGGSDEAQPTLRDMAQAYLKFDSSTWVDSTGNGNTPSPQGAPTSTAGFIKNAATLVKASSQYFQIANSRYTQMSNKDFYIGAWINPATLPTAGQYAALWGKDTSVSNLEYVCYLNGDNSAKFTCQISPDGTWASASGLSVNATLTAGNWYYVWMSRDGQAGTITLGVTTAAGVTTTNTTTLSGVFQGTSVFQIGYNTYLNAIHANPYFDGQIDEMHIFASPIGGGGALSTQQQLALRNDGAGLAWPFGGN